MTRPKVLDRDQALALARLQPGSVVLDANGIAWQRSVDVWHPARFDNPKSCTALGQLAPIRVIHEAGDEA